MNLLSNLSVKPIVRVVLLAGLVLAGSLIAPAQTAGYDLLQTSAGASVDLSDFNLGSVQLAGVPIQGSTGNTDTIMHRTKDGPGSVPVEVYALFMKSTSAVNFNGTQADVYITVNNSGGAISSSTLPQPDTLSPSQGTVTINTDGTFDSSITVNADVIIVPAGGSPSGTSLKTGAARAITLTSKGSPWSSTPPSGYPSSSGLPSGGFYPRPVHTGPHPVQPASCSTLVRTADTPAPVADGTAQQKTSAQAVVIAKCISAVSAN